MEATLEPPKNRVSVGEMHDSRLDPVKVRAENSKKILIVDDEPDLLSILGKRLSTAGYTVMTESNGLDALQTIKDETPELVILDVLMPGMDGEEVAAEIKNSPHTKDIPIIFLSSLLSQWDEDRHGYRLGDSHYMGKPYDPKKLLRKVKSLLES